MKKQIINIVKNHHKNDKKVAEVIELVKKSGGLKYAEIQMKAYHKEALKILNDFEDNDASKSLRLLLDYVINRKK